MKQLIAFILMPVRLFLHIIELIQEAIEPIGNGIRIIIENNYEFWSKIFKWKEGK